MKTNCTRFAEEKVIGQGFCGLLASMEVREAEESSESEGKDAPGGGSVSRSFSSFCIRRFCLAACAAICSVE